MDGAESALEVLRMTSERATNLAGWGQLPNREAKTAEAKALYEDLLQQMERELVRQAPFPLYFCCCYFRPPCLYVMPAAAFPSHPRLRARSSTWGRRCVLLCVCIGSLLSCPAWEWALALDLAFASSNGCAFRFYVF